VSQRLQSYIRKSGAEITAGLVGLAEDREEQGSHHTSIRIPDEHAAVPQPECVASELNRHLPSRIEVRQGRQRRRKGGGAHAPLQGGGEARAPPPVDRGSRARAAGLEEEPHTPPPPPPPPDRGRGPVSISRSLEGAKQGSASRGRLRSSAGMGCVEALGAAPVGDG